MYKFACNPMIGSSASGVEIVHCIKVRLEIVSNDQGNNSMFMLCLEHRTGWKCAHYKYMHTALLSLRPTPSRLASSRARTRLERVAEANYVILAFCQRQTRKSVRIIVPFVLSAGVSYM